MDEYNFKCWAPLVNFSCTLDEFELSQDLQIFKLTDEHKTFLQGLLKNLKNIKFGNFAVLYSVKKEEPASEIGAYLDDGRKIIEKCITTFRLLKKETIGYNVIIKPLGDSLTGSYHAETYRHYELWVGPDTEYRKLQYSISEEESRKVQSLYQEINCPGYEQLELAIQYFNKSYIEPYTPRDSLIDLVISLENLYLKGIKQELRYQLSTKAAMLLTSINDLETRRDIFKKIRKAYDDRSSIIHGEAHPEITHEFMLEIRNYVRKSLIIFIKNPKYRDKLNNIVLSGGIN